ncbi:Uncharacterized protein dnm_095000 [Desulfonema magnum]|uniref:Uncharacterized protein n=1 Tax=Desulfonema magnum TaxID=45655 RepID=A0A975BYB8_9BACT|nr:Uncharacterized protein dnm_095000 [Desulfonema magnum]
MSEYDSPEVIGDPPSSHRVRLPAAFLHIRESQGLSPFSGRNFEGLPSSCVLLFIHATPCGHRQPIRNLARSKLKQALQCF